MLDNIMVERHHLLKAGFLRGIAHWWGGAQREELAHRRDVEETIDALQIQHVRQAQAGTLRCGLRKRVELARAFAVKPRPALLDEPMAGINLEEKEDMARFIVVLNEEWGMTEHDMRVVMGISNRVTVLDFGLKIAGGTPAEAMAHPQMCRSSLGGADDATATLEEKRVSVPVTFPKLLTRNAATNGDVRRVARLRDGTGQGGSGWQRGGAGEQRGREVILPRRPWRGPQILPHFEILQAAKTLADAISD